MGVKISAGDLLTRCTLKTQVQYFYNDQRNLPSANTSKTFGANVSRLCC